MQLLSFAGFQHMDIENPLYLGVEQMREAGTSVCFQSVGMVQKQLGVDSGYGENGNLPLTFVELSANNFLTSKGANQLDQKMQSAPLAIF